MLKTTVVLLALCSGCSSASPGVESAPGDPVDGEGGKVGANDAQAPFAPTTWEDALQAISENPVAYYSYLVQPHEMGGLNYGLVLRFQSEAETAGCPDEYSEFDQNADGWVLYARSISKTQGDYTFDWETSSGSYYERSTGLTGFTASVSFNGGGVTERRIQPLTGTLTLDGDIVPFEQRDDAQPIKGTLSLAFPRMNIEALSCRSSGAAGGVTAETSCECLVGEEEVVQCSPQGMYDQCCARQVADDERVPFTVTFEARPCAGLCEAGSLLGASCTTLTNSDFDSY